MLLGIESLKYPGPEKVKKNEFNISYYALSVIQNDIIYAFELKKCCKKYKKGKRCKKCPAH